MKKMLVVLLAVLFLTQIVSAQHRGMRDTREAGKGLVKSLKLTADQENKFNDINISHQKAMVDFKAKIEKNRIDLKGMLKEGKIDEKKLLQLTNENSKLQAEMKESGIKRWIEINRMLDKDQKEIWVKHLARMSGGAHMIKERMKTGIKNNMIKREMREKNMERRSKEREMMKEKETEK